jgi:BirA family biotin operon repressor/biotin-[acetyl-CoA-carboxylase] ligase
MSALDIDRLRRAFPGRRIDYFASLDSTMHAASGCGPGTVVLADEQTAGQGRHGHSWHSEPGSGIYCSLVLKPMPVLTLALGLAAQNAISEATGLACDIRWPNDLMLAGRKVAGILVQLVGENAVAGIGINVNHAHFPPELVGEATSLRLEAPGNRGPISREEILLALLPAVDQFIHYEKDDVLKLFTQASSYASGRRVTVQQADGQIQGVTVGLDPSGFLIVRKDDGTDTLILAGGVRAAGS